MSHAEPTAPSGTVVDARELGRRFRRSDWAVRDVEVSVERGEIFGLVGPDGAGKTTLMQMFAAILDPTEGSCTVLGFDSVRQAADITSRIGYMSQDFTLYDRLTVNENLEFSAKIRGIGPADYRKRRRRLLGMAGLERFPNRRAEKLSGGMRKKLSLCANLIHYAPLLLLDELSLGVDPLSRHELWAMLHEFVEQGATAVVSTPYMDEVKQCDRVAVLNEGRVLTVGAPQAIMKQVEGRVFEMTSDQPEQAQAVLADSRIVLDVQILPGKVRFQTHATGQLDESLKARLSEVGSLRATEPALGDAFVILSQDRSKDAPPPLLEPRPSEWAGESKPIELRGVTCRFGAFTAVDDVNLSVNPSEVFGFLGPNGAGKTTLIRAMCGLVNPTAGSVVIDGIEAGSNRRTLAQRIGYMSQRFSLYGDLTPLENLNFFAGAYGLRGSGKRHATEWARESTGLGGIAERKVNELSGAARQRLALACSIVHRPAVLFLDEPTSGVDPLSRYRFWHFIRSLARSGMTVFVTTHYLEEATYCDRLGLMYQGHLIASGSLAELQAGLGLEDETSIDDIFMTYMRGAA